MIGLLEGVIDYKIDNSIIVYVSGVGYKVEVSEEILNLNIGDNIKIYTYMHVREDNIKLFGFKNQDQLGLFQLLLGVSGIGPKNAMNLVSMLGLDEIYNAIMNSSSETFRKISGIGSKNAQKIVIELKPKIDKLNINRLVKNSENFNTNINKRHDLENALTSLGYSMNEIKSIEEDLDFNLDIKDILKMSLKLLNNK